MRTPQKTNPTTLPTVRALDALWHQVNQKPLWMSPSKYIKLRRHIRLKPLNETHMQMTAPKWKVNDCSACTDICCVGPRSTVLLTLRDIATLIDIDRTDLIAHNKPTFSSTTLTAHPALNRNLQSKAWHTFPVLKQNAMGACLALTNDGFCHIFPHWPMACERFPYALHVDQGEVFYSQRCDSFWIRSDAQEAVERMTCAAVASYDQRIKDWVLLAYASADLEKLRIMRFLTGETP